MYSELMAVGFKQMKSIKSFCSSSLSQNFEHTVVLLIFNVSNFIDFEKIAVMRILVLFDNGPINNIFCQVSEHLNSWIN